MADETTSGEDATPVEIIAGVIYESDECPDIFESESRELAGDIVEALTSAGYRITRTGDA